MPRYYSVHRIISSRWTIRGNGYLLASMAEHWLSVVRGRDKGADPISNSMEKMFIGCSTLGRAADWSSLGNSKLPDRFRLFSFFFIVFHALLFCSTSVSLFSFFRPLAISIPNPSSRHLRRLTSAIQTIRPTTIQDNHHIPSFYCSSYT